MNPAVPIFSDNNFLLKKLHADVNYLQATVAALQAEITQMKTSGHEPPPYREESIDVIRQRIHDHVTISTFKEFLANKAPTLQQIVSRLKELPLENETTVEVDPATFRCLQVGVAGILCQDMDATGMSVDKQEAKEARREFLALIKDMSKKADLFHGEKPSTLSGRFYKEKIRELCSRIHLYLFRGVGLFVNCSQGSVAISIDGAYL